MPDGKLVNVDDLWKKSSEPVKKNDSFKIDENLLATGVSKTLEVSNALMTALTKFSWNEAQREGIKKVYDMYKKVSEGEVYLKDSMSGQFLSSIDYSNASTPIYEDPGLHAGISFKSKGAMDLFVYGGFRDTLVGGDTVDTKKAFIKNSNHKFRTEETTSQKTNIALSIRDYSTKESATVNISMYQYNDNPQITIENISHRCGEIKDVVVSNNRPVRLANSPEVNGFFFKILDRVKTNIFPCRQ